MRGKTVTIGVRLITFRFGFDVRTPVLKWPWYVVVLTLALASDVAAQEAPAAPSDGVKVEPTSEPQSEEVKPASESVDEDEDEEKAAAAEGPRSTEPILDAKPSSPSAPKANVPPEVEAPAVPVVPLKLVPTQSFDQVDMPVEDKPKEASFLDMGDVEWKVKPEYRVRTVAIRPLEISGNAVGDVGWTEQRFRLDTTVAKVGVGAIRFQADFLDAVLMGDNGEFGGNPSSLNGVTLSANRPNLTKFDIGLLDSDKDPLDRKSYGPVLVPADIWEINYLYADVFLPFGVIRAGRQPKKYGSGIASHDGGPYNRWGVSKFSDAADRILFGTKIDEIFYTLLNGHQHVADPSLNNGLIGAVFYDWQVQDQIYLSEDNLRSIGGALDYRKETADWFGGNWKDVRLSGAFVYLSNDQFESDVFGFPASIEGTVGDLSVVLNYMHIQGQTREVAEGFAVLSGTDPQLQDIVGNGFQAILDYWLGPAMLTLEFDYASGDDDPRVTTALTQYQFARDQNVGLLLFEHIMSFESARSAAVGVENLIGLDASSFPITEVRTEGRFTNAIAIFPQVFVDIVKTPTHNFYTRAGALVAWSAAAGGVVDPILTSLGEDGNEIEDDAVNFHGGDPARYYGTEVDLQLGYKYKHYFHWTVEGAVLFPGPALFDENGDAVNSFMVENRFEFRY